jgi:glycosyltransferase involved in cell wall biosynthesis
MTGRLRIAHVITTTSAGGAERQLLTLVANSGGNLDHTVIGLQAAGELAPAMESAGAEMINLGLKPGPMALIKGPSLVSQALQQAQPQVVQTWLYHSDLLGALAVGSSGKPPLVWGLRNSDLSLSSSTQLVLKACAALSNRPSAILANSRSGADWHQKLGYPAEKIRVIPNGFDTSRFKPNPDARAQIRAELNIPNDAIVVGRVARLDSAKDFPGLAAAAQIALSQQPKLFFLLIGQNVEISHPQMKPWQEPALAQRSLLLGYRDDIPRLLNVMDLHVSNSLSEGLSNALGEAMASGVVSVVTDVGDSREMMGDTGWVVPPAEPAALGQALLDMAGLGSEHLRRLGAKARARIEGHYSLQTMVKAYCELYAELAAADIDTDD